MTNPHQPDMLPLASRPGADCLNTDQLATLLEAPTPSTAALRTHLDSCPHCQTELALLQDFLAAEPSPAEAADLAAVTSALRKNPHWRPAASGSSAQAPSASWWQLLWQRPAALAAGLAAVAAVGLWLQQSNSELAPLREPNESLVRSVQLDGIRPVGDLAAPPPQLEWNAVSGAVQYRVQLFEVDQNKLWEALTPRNAVALPASARSLMLPRKTLLWSVVAINAEGRTIAASSPQEFRVTGSR